MSGFGVVSLTDLPATVAEGVNTSYEYHHYCSPIYTSHQAIFRHQAYMPDINSDNHSGCPEENSFWSSSPRSDSPSPAASSVNYVDSISPPSGQQHGYYQLYTQLPFPSSELSSSYKSDSGYMDPLLPVPMDELNRAHIHPVTGVVRGVKRRNTANKKERRRTQSINAAFQDLRSRIPNVPADTKISKIKTLRLATSYISYLTGVLETDEPAVGFSAELASNGIHGRRPIIRDSGQNIPIDCSASQNHSAVVKQLENSTEEGSSPVLGSVRKVKGRTGWPQHIWALELKQEQNL